MFIYKITNILTNKAYIGQTIQEPRRRWRQHNVAKSNCRGLAGAIQKYGPENFKFTVLCEASSLEELNKMEVFFIKSFKALTPSGYNLKSGGDNSIPSKESRELMRKAQLGKKHSEETKRKLSKILMGHTRNKGCKLSEETKRKMRESANKRPVEGTCLLTGTKKVYPGGIYAEKDGFRRCAISRCCKGSIKSHKGFTWRYI